MKIIDERIVPDLQNNKNIAVRMLDEYPGYGITADGRVWSFYINKWLKQWSTHNGYLRVNLKGLDRHVRHVRVARLVGYCWIENDDPATKDTIDHINFIRTDNRAENLRWVSRSENSRRRRNTKKENKEV